MSGGENSLNVMVDPIRLEQLFFNLLGNAVKFTPEGGEISFRVCNYAVHSGTFSADYVVADTGIGMSREFQELLLSLIHISCPADHSPDWFRRNRSRKLRRCADCRPCSSCGECFSC